MAGVRARYGKLPDFTLAEGQGKRHYTGQPNLLSLLFGAGTDVIPPHMCERLMPKDEKEFREALRSLGYAMVF